MSEQLLPSEKMSPVSKDLPIFQEKPETNNFMCNLSISKYQTLITKILSHFRDG